MSLAQIGEFSFIIAGVGIATGATDNLLYSIAVAVSGITTLLTPWLIRAAEPDGRLGRSQAAALAANVRGAVRLVARSASARDRPMAKRRAFAGSCAGSSSMRSSSPRS